METAAKLTIKRVIAQHPKEAKELSMDANNAVEAFAALAKMRPEFIRLHLGTIKNWI